MLSIDEQYEHWPSVADLCGNIIIKSGKLYKFKNTDADGGYFYRDGVGYDDDLLVENGKIVLAIYVKQSARRSDEQLIWFLVDFELCYLPFNKEGFLQHPSKFLFKELV